MSPRTWQRRSGYHGWTFGRAFDAFAEGRAELLAVLVPMAENAWERTAAVTVPPGQVHERSIVSFLPPLVCSCALQGLIHFDGRRQILLSKCDHPCLAKSVVPLPAAFGTGAMAGGQGCCLVQEE